MPVKFYMFISLSLQGMMIMGFDVTHDTDLKGSSYGALVASLDSQLTSYFSAVSPHRTGNELSNDIAMNVTRALQKYKVGRTSYSHQDYKIEMVGDHLTKNKQFFS